MARVYSEEYKHEAARKFHSRGRKPVAEIANELGISSPTLYEWGRKHATLDGMKKTTQRSPQDWPAVEKLQTIFEFERLCEQEQGEFLRKKGLHSEHLTAWKKILIASLDPSANEKVKPLRKEIVGLKAELKTKDREINRKDRALAEVSALLILKKKVQAIWGSGEDE